MSTPGLAALSNEVNPDLLLAQRVLGGLVRGCEQWPAPIAWAVGVIKTSVGSQVVVASSLGGGSYVPSTVFLPVTARLAVVDPALPYGWSARPSSKLLILSHCSRTASGVSLTSTGNP